MKKVTLKPTKEKSLLRKHPWVFSGAIKKIDENILDGDVVKIFTNKDKYLATGHYTEGNISVRIFDFENKEIDEEFWKEKIKNALQQRKETLKIDKNNNVYRLIHAEGDYLPGFICDIYNEVAVFQFHSIGMWKIRKLFTKIVKELLPNIELIYDKSVKTIPKKHVEEFSVKDGYLYNNSDITSTVVSEYGNKFKIDWVNGQKTGFFIDQRENRKFLGELAKDKKILNTFCYSGGFSIYALNAGAKEVHSLDSSQKAIDLVDENIELLANQNIKHLSIAEDAMDFIKEMEDEYDIIVLDPPAFAKHMKVKHKALQGYKRLNTRAIEQIRPNGILFTFSCSQVIDNNLFRHMVLSSAIIAGRNVSILKQLHQPSDHPINIFHPESEYLKGLILKVE
ncbi:MAG: class I SAM-dependent rRNA methyltransferase [Flavobacteriales bacterium]|nr:class I SAM-dependent rRNA methyltransferase [Flavobacteriales bacterium]MDG1798509.1 class I SAM-dependent rRNA methyltransferase [Flavobacteriales bacterium]